MYWLFDGFEKSSPGAAVGTVPMRDKKVDQVTRNHEPCCLSAISVGVEVSPIGRLSRSKATPGAPPPPPP